MRAFKFFYPVSTAHKDTLGRPLTWVDVMIRVLGFTINLHNSSRDMSGRERVEP